MIKSDLRPLETIDPYVLGRICYFAGTTMTGISKRLESQRETFLFIVIENMQLFPRYFVINPTKFSLKSLNIYLEGLAPKEEYNRVSNFAIYNIQRYKDLDIIIKNYEDLKLTQLAEILAEQIPDIPKGDAESIRNFLKNPANSEKLNKITILDLSTTNFPGNTKPNFESIPKEIQYFPNLQNLGLAGNKISDLSPLARLKNLTKLNLSYNQISDLSPLAQLVKLVELELIINQISNLTPLAGLVNLKRLTLNDNKISDLKPLAALVSLTSLLLTQNEISDLKPLAALVSLTSLSLAQNKISDLKPLAELVNLDYLCLAKNEISDLYPLRNLKKLLRLYLKRNKISDLTPILDLNLWRLTIAHNFLASISDELRETLYEKIKNFNPDCLANQRFQPEASRGGGGTKETRK